MNKNISIVAGVVALVVIIGGVYVATNNKNAGMIAKENAGQIAMAHKDSDTIVKDQKMMGAGVVLKSGTIMLEQNGTTSPLAKEYVFETGVKVSLTGAVMKKDGTIIQLKEGESTWADGTIMKAESDSMMKKDETNEMNKSDTIMKAGSYEVYSPEKIGVASDAHQVVLFFRASWCPTCIGLDKDIKANLGKIPSNLTILDVNYDNSSDLKKKYGVTYQHTFVQVDKNGNMIKKWSGSPTLSVLVSEVK